MTISIFPSASKNKKSLINPECPVLDHRPDDVKLVTSGANRWEVIIQGNEFYQLFPLSLCSSRLVFLNVAPSSPIFATTKRSGVGFTSGSLTQYHRWTTAEAWMAPLIFSAKYSSDTGTLWRTSISRATFSPKIFHQTTCLIFEMGFSSLFSAAKIFCCQPQPLESLAQVFCG